MKKYFLICALIILSTFAFGQSYLGRTLSNTILKTSSSSNSRVILNVSSGSQIFIVSLQDFSGYYNVIDITTNKEGYMPRSKVKIGQQVRQSEDGIFSSNGMSSSDAPEVEIYNNTNLTLTLKLNENTYSFLPRVRRTITLPTGNCSYRASAPGVIPNIGTETVLGSHSYKWQFYITRR